VAADGRIDADAVVLATGNLPPVAPGPVPPGRYVAGPWEPGALDAVADGSPVAVLGAGLSMLDVAIALTDAHPRTAVHAICRHALLPREHSWPRPAAAPAASSRSSTSGPGCGCASTTAAPSAELAVGWLVNCTGPAADIAATAHPLLRQLLDVGPARPDPLRLGLDTGPRGAVRDAHRA
jgi:uncharacterized NAD(P)/FAD-binding protein YdhS